MRLKMGMDMPSQAFAVPTTRSPPPLFPPHTHAHTRAYTHTHTHTHTALQVGKMVSVSASYQCYMVSMPDPGTIVVRLWPWPHLSRLTDIHTSWDQDQVA